MITKKTFIQVAENGKREIIFDTPGLYAVFFHNISGKLLLDIRSEEVELHIFGLYTGGGADRFELSTVQLHNAPRSSSNLLVKGVFRDKSQFLYDGLIRIEKTGSGSHAYQKNQNLILSEDAFVSSKPDLEILAQDVFCTHGSTTGRLNRNQQYYVRSRGLNNNESDQLLVAGFVSQLYTQLGKLGFVKEAARYKQLFV